MMHTCSPSRARQSQEDLQQFEARLGYKNHHHHHHHHHQHKDSLTLAFEKCCTHKLLQ
jgi:hypothetical protein